MRLSTLVLLIPLTLLPLGCGRDGQDPPALGRLDRPAAGRPDIEPVALDAARFETFLQTSAGNQDALAGLARPTPLRRSLQSAYQARGFRPLWFPRGRPTGETSELVAALEAAPRDGLKPDVYRPRLLAAQLRQVRRTEAGEEALYPVDTLFSEAFLLFSQHLSVGRVDPAELGPTWHIERRRPDLAAALDQATGPGSVSEVVDRLRPPHPEYRRLQDALERYRRIAQAGGWPAVPEGPVIEAGDRAPRDRLVALAKRLEAEGDLAEGAAVLPPAAARAEERSASPAQAAATGSKRKPAAAPQAPYGGELAQAVRRFQARLGLTIDGIVGPETVDAMNVTALARVRQIELNMERWRWLPADLGPRRLEVNIPAFMLRVVDGGRTVSTMKVVVGKTGAATPAFSDSMTYVVLNPYWNVPESITRHEIAPEAARDPSYLAAHGYEVVVGGGDGDVRRIGPRSIDWASVAAGGSFPYRVRQRPGPDNALGRIKFMLPNDYNIYLHDTPSEHLFKNAQRDFSHGCVRVEHPLELAQWVFQDDPRWTRQRLASAVASGRRESIALPQPIPVYLLYWTAWVDGDGTTHFRDDVYGQDQALAQALAAADTRQG